MMYTFRKAITRALSLCGGVALLTSVVACDSSDLSLDERPANEVTTAKKPVMKFSILKHGNGVSVGADMQEYEDEIRSLYIHPFGEISLTNLTKTGNYLKAEWPVTMPPVGTPSLQFVTNLTQSDLQKVRSGTVPSSLYLNTRDYLRGYNGNSKNYASRDVFVVWMMLPLLIRVMIMCMITKWCFNASLLVLISKLIRCPTALS